MSRLEEELSRHINANPTVSDASSGVTRASDATSGATMIFRLNENVGY